MHNVKDKLALGRLRARNKAKYFQELFLSFVPTEVKGLGTVGATKNMLFLYDPVVILKWSSDLMEFAWWHEAMHVILRHFDRLGTRDPKIWNLAGDCFINDQGKLAGFNLPEWAVTPETYGLPGNLTTEEYYDALWQRAQEQGQSNGEGGQNAGKEGQQGGKSTQGKNPAEGNSGGSSGGKENQPLSEGGFGAGHCGSAAGHELPDEPQGGDTQSRSDAEVTSIVKRAAESVKAEAQKGRGSVPAGLARWAEAVLGPARIPWQQKLAKLTRTAIAYRPGAVDFRWSRPSRRQAALGYGPGKPVMPGLISPVPRVAVVLDTSGSMGTEEVKIGLEETAGILRTIGADVTFCACDARVHELQKVRTPSQLHKLVKGGGGTDFRPAFIELNKGRQPPEVIVFVTDGCGPVPATPPKQKVIWLLVGPWKQRPCEWGEAVELE